MAYNKTILAGEENIPGANTSLLQDATGTPKTSPLSLTTTVAQTIVVPASCTHVTFEGFDTNVDATAHIRIYQGAAATGGYWALHSGRQVTFAVKGFGSEGYPTQFTLVNSASATHGVNIKYDCMTADGS